MTTYPLARSSSLSRRLMPGLLAALLAIPMLVGHAQAAGLDEIKKRGLIVATEDDFRPFEFVKDGKPTGAYEDFLVGFVGDDKSVWGRPVGVGLMRDGSLLVRDDGSNSIWRVSYKGK